MAHQHYRAHLRFPVLLDASVRSSRGVSMRARVVNLGVGGLSAEAEHPLRLGEAVELLVLTDEPLRLNGHVTWVGWAERSLVRFGVHFVDTPTEAVILLLEVLGARTGDVG
jgi:Tfp pilus assembly protein PilZ